MWGVLSKSGTLRIGFLDTLPARCSDVGSKPSFEPRHWGEFLGDPRRRVPQEFGPRSRDPPTSLRRGAKRTHPPSVPNAHSLRLSRPSVRTEVADTSPREWPFLDEEFSENSSSTDFSDALAQLRSPQCLASRRRSTPYCEHTSKFVPTLSSFRSGAAHLRLRCPRPRGGTRRALRVAFPWWLPVSRHVVPQTSVVRACEAQGSSGQQMPHSAGLFRTLRRSGANELA